jgi:outer membrane immunogenic protein
MHRKEVCMPETDYLPCSFIVAAEGPRRTVRVQLVVPMKQFLLTASLALMATGAHAADATSGDPQIIHADASTSAAPVAERWGGFYAGANIGYGFLKDTIPAEGKDWLYGGFAGYNKQWGNFVVGIEGGIDYADIMFTDGSGIKSKYMYTGRVRAGWANDILFAYGSIGVQHGTTVNLPPANSKDTAMQLGAGIDFAVTQKVSLGTDYTYTKYKNFGDLPLDVTTQKVQARITYTFN